MANRRDIDYSDLELNVNAHHQSDASSDLEAVPPASQPLMSKDSTLEARGQTPPPQWTPTIQPYEGYQKGPDSDKNYAAPPVARRPIWKRKLLWLVLLGLVIIIALVGGIVGAKAGKKSNKKSSSHRDPSHSNKTTTTHTMTGKAALQSPKPFPVPVSYGYPDLDILFADDEGTLTHKFRQPAQPSAFGPTPAGFETIGNKSIVSKSASAVAALWRGPDKLNLFAINATDSSLIHAFWGPQPEWSTPGSRGGEAATSPTVISWGDDRMDCFVIGTDAGLYQLTLQDPDGWLAWNPLGGSWPTTYGPPTAVTWGQGRLDAFLVGPDNALYHRYAETNGIWQSAPGNPFENLGGHLTSRPAAVSWGSGRIDVFARGGDAGLWTTSFDNSVEGGWGNWTWLDEDVIGEPEAVSWAAGRIDVFAWGADKGFRHLKYDGGNWADTEDLGGSFAGPPKAVSDKEGSLHVFGFSNDGELMHKAWNETLKAWAPEKGYENLGKVAV